MKHLSSLPPSFLPSPYEFHSVVRGMTLHPLTSFVQSASGRLESGWLAAGDDADQELQNYSYNKTF